MTTPASNRSNLPLSLKGALVAIALALSQFALLSPTTAQLPPIATPDIVASTQKALLATDVASSAVDYLDFDSNGVRKILERIATNPNLFPPDFNDLSPLQQLQWAHASTELSKPGVGDELVARFILNAGQLYPSIKLEPRLRQYIDEHPYPPTQFELVVSEVNLADHSPEESVARAIALVTEIVSSRGASFTATSLLRDRLGLTSDEVVERVLKFGSGPEALRNHLTTLPDPPQKTEIAKVAAALMAQIPAARRDPTLGEAVFRWLGLGDPRYREWFRIRDETVERIQQGQLNIPDHKKPKAIEIGTVMRADFARMPGMFLDKNGSISPNDIERMFYEYIVRSPSVAAAWSFMVISIKDDLDFDRYLNSDIKAAELKIFKELLPNRLADVRREIGRPLTESEKTIVSKAVWEAVRELDIRKTLKEHGPKPYHGFMEYSRLTAFGEASVADKFARSEAFNSAVGGLCPTD